MIPKEGGKMEKKYLYICLNVCVCLYTMEQGTCIAREDGGRWSVIIITIYYGGRDPYCMGGWGKMGYYYYHYILLEEETRIAWAECEDCAMLCVMHLCK